jgi:hypothetical protein
MRGYSSGRRDAAGCKSWYEHSLGRWFEIEGCELPRFCLRANAIRGGAE